VAVCARHKQRVGYQHARITVAAKPGRVGAATKHKVIHIGVAGTVGVQLAQGGVDYDVVGYVVAGGGGVDASAAAVRYGVVYYNHTIRRVPAGHAVRDSMFDDVIDN
jgi:hypothetical protein